jgi:hypothetical protein
MVMLAFTVDVAETSWPDGRYAVGVAVWSRGGFPSGATGACGTLRLSCRQTSGEQAPDEPN